MMRLASKKTRRKKKALPKGRMRFTQIATGSFGTPEGSSYSVLALGEDGKVYRFDPKCNAWIPWSDKIATCGPDHKAGR